MRVKVMSVVPVNYINKRTGKDVVGFELNFIREFNEREKSKNPRGKYICDKIFTRLDTSTVVPEQEYDLVYECIGGRYADLVGIKKVS